MKTFGDSLDFSIRFYKSMIQYLLYKLKWVNYWVLPLQTQFTGFSPKESKWWSGRKRCWRNDRQRKAESMVSAVFLSTERTKKNEKNSGVWWGLGWHRRAGRVTQSTNYTVLRVTEPRASWASTVLLTSSPSSLGWVFMVTVEIEVHSYKLSL